MNYYWVRIFDYKKDNDLKEYTTAEDWENRKGTLLDEYYLCGEDMTREQAKQSVKEKSSISKFAKPRKNDGVYALVIESNQFFYDRFTKEVDDVCFNCHTPIKGKMKDFPNMNANDGGEKRFFCCWDCKRETLNKINPHNEGDWQNREDYETNGGVYGYIYHIYNRRLNKHYIGQTIYMPFFRWQEHAKGHIKGDITDLIFEVITEVRIKSQEYLNSIEAWWIRKFIDEYGKENVFNVSVPKITIEDLQREYAKIVVGQMKLQSENEIEVV